MALEHDRGIATAEAERIASRDIDAPMAGDVRNVIKVALRVRILVVYGRRNEAFLKTEREGGHLEGSRNILELAKYSLFLESLRFESEGRGPTFTSPAMSAVELMVRIVRAYGYSGFPLQDYMRLMGMDAIGRMGIHPKDRLSWSIVTNVLAMLPKGTLLRANDTQMADNLTWLLLQTQQLLDEGPWNKANETEIYEVASMLFVGSAHPSAEVCAITTAENEYIQGCNARASLPNLEDMADILGIDLDRGSALLDM